MSIYLLTSEPAALFQWPSTIVSSNKCKRLGPQRRQFLWKRAREMPATVREKQHDKNYPPHPATHQPELVPLLQVPNEGLYNTTIYHYITYLISFPCYWLSHEVMLNPVVSVIRLRAAKIRSSRSGGQVLLLGGRID